MTTMYDATHDLCHNIPADAEQVAGYKDGASWCAWTPDDWARFPNARKVTITVVGNNNDLDADVADCERGDFTPQTAAAWARAKINAGKGRPTIYCSTSDHDAVVAELAKVGLQFVRDVDWWEAHYDNDAALSSGSVAKQYQSTPQYDLSITNGQWPNQPVPVIQTQHFPEDNMQLTTTTLSPGLDASGNGWYSFSALGIPAGAKLVTVNFFGSDPSSGGYTAPNVLPKWYPVPGKDELVIVSGEPNGRYAVEVWSVP